MAYRCSTGGSSSDPVQLLAQLDRESGDADRGLSKSRFSPTQLCVVIAALNRVTLPFAVDSFSLGYIVGRNMRGIW